MQYTPKREVSDLGAVLLAGRRHIIYVLLCWRLMSRQDVVLVLVRFPRVVHVNLSNTSRNHHLETHREQVGKERGVRV